MRIKIKTLSSKNIGEVITIKGWVRSIRASKKFSFIALNDGSTLSSIQIVADDQTNNYATIIEQLATGAAIAVDGTVVESPGKEQSFEIKAHDITVIGGCDAENYPLQKKQHSFEFLRTIAHLRPRTNTLGAVTRIRSALAIATHEFFSQKGFLYIHTPIITESDCEGAGEMFKVTTMDLAKPSTTKDGKVDYTQDFFGKPAYLTVSGQLNGETYACALSDIYTFGPTFRAENSNTSRHLAEFWMIEPEMAFADLKDDMDCAENYLKYCLNYVLKKNSEDLEIFNKFIAPGLIEQLTTIAHTSFDRIDYTQAIEILQKSNKKFDYPVVWGNDLQTEHERFLAEEYCKKPVFIINYPKTIKPFYMHCNDDNKTVAAMDLLVPGIGELIGGSQREARLNILEQRMDAQDLDKEQYWWYLDLRRYGSVPHAGFGLGFERLVQFCTGMENIRDVIPFPRTPKHLEF